MKKLIAILLAAMMLVSFAACANDTNDKITDGTAADASANVSDNVEATDDVADTDAEFLSTIRVGTGGTTGKIGRAHV